jgi:uncharacterized membrane protein
MPYVKMLILLPFFAVIYQMYSYAVSRQREEKQRVCRGLGIILFSIGSASLVSRDYLFVFTGLILMMSGFRLIAHGLDRLDKKVFIDSYNPSAPD